MTLRDFLHPISVRRSYSVFLFYSESSLIPEYQKDLICFLIQHDLYVRRERLSVFGREDRGGGVSYRCDVRNQVESCDCQSIALSAIRFGRSA